jgi:hypothetical protein
VSWLLWNPPISDEALLAIDVDGSQVAVRRKLGDGALCVTENSPMGAGAVTCIGWEGDHRYVDLVLGVNEYVNRLGPEPTLRVCAGEAPTEAVEGMMDPPAGRLEMGPGVWLCVLPVTQTSQLSLLTSSGVVVDRLELPARPT